MSFSDRAVLKEPIQFIGSVFSVITSIQSMTETDAVKLILFLQKRSSEYFIRIKCSLKATEAK